MLVELERRRRLQQGDTPQDDPLLKEAALRKAVIGADDSSIVRSAVELFDDIIGDFRPRDPPRSTASKVVQPDMQAFLAPHYVILQKEGDSKPSGSKGGIGTGAAAAESSSRRATARGAVGPMSAGSQQLPATAQAPAAEESVSTRPRKSGVERRERERERPAEREALAPPTSTRTSARPSSPSGSSSTGAPKQSEVLQSFFQSLLKDSPGTSRTQRKPSGSGGSAGPA